MEPLHAVLLVIIGLGAGFVQRVSGFGLAIFAMLFLPHFLPSHTAAAAIATIFSFVTSTFNTVRYRKQIALKTALPMLAAALVSIPIAVRFSTMVSGEIFTVLLGAVLILLSVYFMVFSSRISIRPTLVNGILAGSFSGVLGGLFSTSGPPAVLYLSSATGDTVTYFATIQFFFCLTNLHATIMRVADGIVNAEILLYAAVGVVGCLAGDAVGKLVFDKLHAAALRYVIYGGMLLSGVVMLF